jgi:hypothetical protein
MSNYSNGSKANGSAIVNTPRHYVILIPQSREKKLRLFLGTAAHRTKLEMFESLASCFRRV